MRTDYDAQFGSFRQRYLPQSPQHLGSDDSLQIVQMSREGPDPIPAAHRNYELTFKKNERDQYFMESKEEVQRGLLTPSQRQMLNHLRQPISYYYCLSLEALSAFPFADLYSLDLQERDQSKLSLIGEVLELKRLYAKSRSVAINLACLRGRDSLSHQERNKLFLLELLQKQLSKKYFIEALRSNLMQKKYLVLYGEDQDPEIWRPPKNPEKSDVGPIIQEEVEQEREWQHRLSHEGQYQEQDSINSELQGQIIIFTQVVSGIAKKQLFSAFNSIVRWSKNIQKPNFMKPLGGGQLSPIPAVNKIEYFVKSPKTLSNEHIYLEQEQQQQSFNCLEGEALIEDERETQQKLAELEAYMQQLHEECAQTTSLLKRYFLKWKIYLLQAIAISIIQQIRYQQEQEPLQSIIEEETSRNVSHQNEEHLPEAIPDQIEDLDQAIERQSAYSWSRNTSEASQVGYSLKHQKRELKTFIFTTQAKIFLSNLRENQEAKRIKSIVKQVREQKIIKKAFEALKDNRHSEIKYRQMEDYYQEVSNSQDEDEKTSYFFWKTNLLHKYFQLLVQYRRHSVFCRVLARTTLKITFRAIAAWSMQRKQKSTMLQRWQHYRQRQILFRSFSIWKQIHRLSSGYTEKVRSFRLLKQKQLVDHCFSILKLVYKKGLIKQIKADYFYQQRIQLLAFSSFKMSAEEGRLFKEKQFSLTQYLLFSKSTLFVHNFRSFYRAYLEHQRLIVKEQKIRRIILGLQAHKGLKRWRALTMKKSAYSAIETRLVRLKQKEMKRKIYYAWLQITREPKSQSVASGTDKHKEWLVQYYSGLCSLQRQ